MCNSEIVQKHEELLQEYIVHCPGQPLPELFLEYLKRRNGYDDSDRIVTLYLAGNAGRLSGQEK